MTTKRERLSEIAEALAQKPLVGNARKAGPDLEPILSYFPRNDLSVAFDWCAAFVYHCCIQADFNLPVRYPEPVSCNFAGVLAWLQWGQLRKVNAYHSAEEQIFTPTRGDLVVFDNLLDHGPHDHIGIVLGCDGDWLSTAEGKGKTDPDYSTDTDTGWSMASSGWRRNLKRKRTGAIISRITWKRGGCHMQKGLDTFSSPFVP